MAPLAAAITRSPSHCQRDGHDFRPLLQILATYDLRFVEALENLNAARVMLAHRHCH
jgi:hypothetical protein